MHGKIIGAIVGACSAMLVTWSVPIAAVLALAGALVGHLLIDQYVSQVLQVDWPVVRAVAFTRADLVDPIALLFIEVARADSAVSQDEVRVMRSYFEEVQGFDAAAMEQVRVSLKRAMASSGVEVEAAARSVALRITEPRERLILVRWLYDVALAGSSTLANSESAVLKVCVAALEVSDGQLQQITSSLFGSGAASYATLGLTAAASDGEIRSAYRRLAAQNHPDSAGPSGAERFHQIKEAYETLRRIRGF